MIAFSDSRRTTAVVAHAAGTVPRGALIMSASCATYRSDLVRGPSDLAHDAATLADYFGLPMDRTVVIGSHIDV